MNFLLNYGLFLIKFITIIMVISTVILVFISGNLKKKNLGKLQITNLSEDYDQIKKDLQLAKIPLQEKKTWLKNDKKEKKKKLKTEKLLMKKGEVKSTKPTLYVIDFKGSIDAKEVDSLRREVSAILSVNQANDEILIRLESCGGVVNGYGLAASQIKRMRDRGLHITVAVDKVAASGGYMMACVANHIVAAPFSIVGSIGVIAQIPNFNRLLKNNNIDVEMHTAGKYKRTLTLLGENTEEGREKFKEELNQTHLLFKNFVHKMRPNVNIDSISTGEYWYGDNALQLGLIDELGTSDDFIIKYMNKFNIISISYIKKRGKIFDYLADSTNKILYSYLLDLWINFKKKS
ncbi:protease SohB [Candidatus Pantoea edessiphila]|uniref:Protease SohB n=1 Tax=Candidatus Pantoea edessiphila TaxID=2044610 RepID=A0A2P5SYP6_9GAMM|nr:protease SohB [Candidatus Pantoea edessiphila]MBK4775412.1 protease SohB [Pantoea sp. Edef]PPI87458.1 protease SohB [Candidatus Pantoea edessiphila]